VNSYNGKYNTANTDSVPKARKADMRTYNCP